MPEIPGASPLAPTSILCVDPGDTTGFARFELIRGTWEMTSYGQFGSDETYEQFLRGSDWIVLEETPMATGTPRQREVIIKCYEVAKNDGVRASGIYPMQWKPWAERRAVDKEARSLVGANMRHAADAFCMGRYMIWKEGL